ncbi:4-hydroxyphenylacetate 3-hydroxylase [Aureococcus anophagefferens]|nr:4-hydroxyphenylacetate 3-hydroxylase [Aureococcus anophagefferens]
MRAALARRAVLARPAPSAAATRSRSAQALEAPYVEETYVALDRDRRHAAPVAFAESYAAPAFGRISTGDQYVASLRGRDLPVYLFGENIDEFVDHPIVWPSVNAVAETYRLAEREPELATVYSSLIGGRVHRFAHICESAEDVVAQNRMQRKMGQLTGACFQRCVGQDCVNASWTTTHLIDAAHGTAYQARLKAFVQHVQSYNLTVGGAMTDPKGDRSKPRHAQEDPDMFVRVVDRRPDGVVLRGAKVHQTGTLNSHWMVVMPGQRLAPADADYAISAAIPVDDPRVSYILGRQSCDTRSMEPSGVDVGNAKFGGQEVTVVLDDVFVPYDRVFMDGETEFAADLVERFTAYHRRSYVCKAGASHIKDKLIEMTHLNETIFGMGIAASMSAKPTPAGNYEPDDLAGGVVVTMPSDDDFNSEEIGAILKKYLCAAPGVDPDDRRRVLRLIENMTMGRNAVGYLAESMHGAGSPAAQRVLIQKLGQIAEKRGYARDIAGCGGACSTV